MLQYGWFGIVARAMLRLLRFLHDFAHFPYALAIICMTMMVRACLFPLSKKMAMGAKKMKELQPKIQELKAKFGDDREKMAKAQMELFRKNNYNPLAGCLPMFLQLPIFIGLYTALNASVDLRLAKFLWVDNLAAPDRLFHMPWSLPFLGQYFNLLPVITVVLFLIQQKMFMPPPTDEQQAMQQKMMNFMMIFMGFLFWHVPAGLCVYFVASSLWGLGERKMLDFIQEPDDTGRSQSSPEPEKPARLVGVKSAKVEAKPTRGPTVWERLMDAASAGGDGASMQATGRDRNLKNVRKEKLAKNARKKGKKKSDR